LRSFCVPARCLFLMHHSCPVRSVFCSLLLLSWFIWFLSCIFLICCCPDSYDSLLALSWFVFVLVHMIPFLHFPDSLQSVFLSSLSQALPLVHSGNHHLCLLMPSRLFNSNRWTRSDLKLTTTNWMNAASFPTPSRIQWELSQRSFLFVILELFAKPLLLTQLDSRDNSYKLVIGHQKWLCHLSKTMTSAQILIAKRQGTKSFWSSLKSFSP
jgi:hypothetical protein